MIARDREIEEPNAASLRVADDGCAIVPQVVTAEDIRCLLLGLEESTSQRTRAGVRHLLSNPVVAELAADLRLLGIAQSVLGRDAFPFKATLFDKSSMANWLITWHQGTALPLRERQETPGWGPWSTKEGIIYAHALASALERVVALRLHLDDSNQENGPLRVIPGSHCQGVLSDQQVETVVGQIEHVTCLVEQGGVIVMRPLLIHASSKSQSDKPRRVLHIEYATRDTVAAPLQLAIA
ncbi:MAG: phytanoyl-CoA dioxygenase family protein [Acidobacteriia bacterium]|nr:phytanoyl-CoA dioxygenase family protein [Terriglobia bacterium]